MIMVIPAALLSLAIAIGFLSWWLKRLKAEAVNALREEVGAERVYHVEDCNFLGLLSKGYAQVRGNGALALTDRGIRFRMLLPRRHLFIPLASVRGTSRQRSFLGKTKFRELLRVDFVNDRGEEDACAWLVPSLDWWLEAVEALRSSRVPPPAPQARG